MNSKDRKYVSLVFLRLFWNCHNPVKTGDGDSNYAKNKKTSTGTPNLNKESNVYLNLIQLDFQSLCVNYFRVKSGEQLFAGKGGNINI